MGWGRGRCPRCLSEPHTGDVPLLHFSPFQAARKTMWSPQLPPVSAEPCSLPHQAGGDRGAERHRCPRPTPPEPPLARLPWLQVLAGPPRNPSAHADRPEWKEARQREALVFREEAQEMGKLGGCEGSDSGPGLGTSLTSQRWRCPHSHEKLTVALLGVWG